MRRQIAQSLSRPVSPFSLWIILGGALILFLQLGYITFDIYSIPDASRFSAISLYRECLGEYIISELLLIVSGAFFVDLADRP